MASVLNMLLVVVLALNLYLLGNSRLSATIRIVAAQGALIGVMPLLVHQQVGLAAFAVSVAAILLKGVLIPWMLMRALREAQIKREVEPLIGFLPSMILGALATAFALAFASHLPLAREHTSHLLVPASVATVLSGFILLTTRYKALSQVIGYLVLENGVFIFGLLLIEAMPLIVEMGVLLDLFVGIFVISIIVNHINRAFSLQNTPRFGEQKD
ncbi:MAG TPA: hydrogenase [Candidatus Sumerlaeota bacterium]|nr:hydrogenase [Candidatus Sumerlaeota bacterium]HPS02099.1 hydrogenase [Candidatus Sumerlaeota bacterium]